jgi:hypothetical protein
MAMWYGTLRGDDIQRATAEIKSQRAAIRARFDYEMKQLETKAADLEALEDSVLNFVSNYTVEDGSSVPVAHPRPAAETVAHPRPAAATVAHLEPAAETVTDPGPTAETVAHPRPAAAKVAGEIASEQSSSTSPETPDARQNVTSLNPRDSSGVWTPTERALLAIKRN